MAHQSTFSQTGHQQLLALFCMCFFQGLGFCFGLVFKLSSFFAFSLSFMLMLYSVNID